jgi:hypothetical protein
VGDLVRRADADLAAALAGVLRRLGVDDADAVARVLIAVVIGISAQKAISPEPDVDAHAQVFGSMIERLFRSGVPAAIPDEERTR